VHSGVSPALIKLGGQRLPPSLPRSSLSLPLKRGSAHNTIISKDIIHLKMFALAH